jgi:hypothetical protein
MSEELKSGFYYTTKYTTKKLIDECEFKIQFSKKIIECNYYVMYYNNNKTGQY